MLRKQIAEMQAEHQIIEKSAADVIAKK
jgi:hypothetical protein